MIIELKMNSSGIYPTYLNLTSSGDFFQYQNTPSVEFVDFSSCTNAFIVIEQPIEINNKDITVNKALHITND